MKKFKNAAKVLTPALTSAIMFGSLPLTGASAVGRTLQRFPKTRNTLYKYQT